MVAIRAFTRNGNDWTRAGKRVVDGCGARRACEMALIDGEMVVQDERGITDFRPFASAAPDPVFCLRSSEPSRLVHGLDRQALEHLVRGKRSVVSPFRRFLHFPGQHRTQPKTLKPRRTCCSLEGENAENTEMPYLTGRASALGYHHQGSRKSIRGRRLASSEINLLPLPLARPSSA